MTHPNPPRLALRFLDAFLPEESRDAVIGDIVERWEQSAAGRPFGAARFYMEAMQAVVTMQFLRPDSSAFEPAQSESFVQGFLSDLRRGARSLARAPGFSLVAIGTLAIAIGATAALVSVANPLLFRVLPYSRPKQLVMLNERMNDGTAGNLGYATYKDLRDGSHSFTHSAAFGTWEPTLFGEQEGERLRGLRVTWDFFRTLGVQPTLGRDFVLEDDTPDNVNVVILSHSLWQRRFGGDSSIVGRTIDLASATRPTVVGVLPASFENVLDPPSEIYRVLGYATQNWACRSCRHLRAIGRLRDDVTLEQASRELDPMMKRLAAEYPNTYPGAGVVIERMSDRVTSSTRAIFGVVIGAVALLLLIAAANVVNLQLARAARRESEFAVRAALGAGRGRIARQLFAEGLVIAAAGGIAGVIVAAVALPSFVAVLPETLPRLASISLDATVLGVIALLVLFVAVAMGMFPAFQAGTRSLFSAIRAGGARGGGTPHHRTRSGIVVAEVALAMMLVIGATLLGRSMLHLLSVDLGFQPSGLVTMTMESAGPRYDSAAKVFAHHDRVREAVRRVPGVKSVALASQLPLGGNFDQYGVFTRENGPDVPVAAAQRYAVTWDYPRTMGMRIVSGRAFTEEETRDTAVRVAIVSESMAQRIAPGGDPLGKYVRIGGGERPWIMVVGVAADTRHEGVDQGAVLQIYVPERHWLWEESTMILVARVEGDAAGFVRAVREAARGVDPVQPISRIATMEQLVSRSMAQRRLGLILFVAFSAMALLLAGAGIFGVLAGAVTERTREFGVRTAFGATPASITGLVLRQGGTLAAIGLVLGGAGSLMLSRYLGALLFEVKTRDPASIVLGVAVVIVVALVACIVPARRATKTDPIVALRAE
jgi:putative ABC transport system permease protein